MSLPKSKVFLLCCLAGNLGLGFGYKISYSYMAILAMFFVVGLSLGHRKRAFLIFGLIAICLCGASAWSKMKQPDDLSELFGTKQRFKAVAVSDPNVTEKAHSFIARVTELNGDQTDARIYIILPKYPRFEYGMEFEMEGKLEAVSEFNTKDNLSAQIVYPKILSFEPGRGNFVKNKLYELKKYLTEKITKLLPAPESGLLGGFLLGTKNLPEHVIEQFRSTGTSHIIAVSGFNVTLVVNFLGVLLGKFGRKVSFHASVFGIVGFVIITGATASVVRAGIMGSLVLVAKNTGRLYASVNALILTSMFMLVQNPKLLQFDVGYQLSFGALLGLLFVQPILENRFPNAKLLSSTIFPTLAAQITTAPIILYHFGSVSLVSVLTNFLILPLIPLGMLLGFAALMAYIILPPIGQLLGMVVWLLLKYVLWTVEVTSRIPAAVLDKLNFSLLAVMIYYLILSVAIWKIRQKQYLSL